ncbi:MAG TPA: glutathione S-transferase family protein [Rhizomicrobium sp.]|jgi:glutathione S-transferase|nr:glutathione S-transferase family protein [Rhizomicrobium sp.]
MLKIWGRANSINVQKAMWAVGESGVAHQRIDAGGQFGGLQTPEFRAMNPNTRIPVIDDEGTIVWESHAIVRYVAAKYGKGTLWAEDPAERAKADMWIEWTQCDLQNAFMGVFAGYWRTPENQRNMNMVRNAWMRTNTLLQLLDQHLAGKKFITGESFTMGDIPPGAQLFRYYEMQIPLERPKLPNVEAWYARLKDRPAYREHVMVSFQDLKGR